MDPPTGIRIVHAAGVTRLKWHRAKRSAEDVPFSSGRIIEAFRSGASFEVDIRPHGDGGFLVIHDETLDRETTGSGPVRRATGDTLRHLRMRTPDGTPTDLTPLLLEDLCDLAAGPDGSEHALCQLDLKAGMADLDDRSVAAFANALERAPARFVVSGGDAEAVRLLGRTAGIAIGYDPSDEARGRDPTLPGAADAFVADAVAAVPEARIIYLDWRLAIRCIAAGADLIGRFHAAGREVDAYTLVPGQGDLPDVLRRLLAAGVDQITTDEPDALERIAAQLSGCDL